jgi:hypothetical protein
MARRFQPGQALVEFVIASTLILLLLAAAVDIGLLFFNMQGLTTAAQEGATYGSRYLIVRSDGSVDLDYDMIRTRVRQEAGTTGGINFVNMYDLNSDAIPDAADTNGDGVLDQFQYFLDQNGDGRAIGDPVTGLIPAGTEPSGYVRLIDHYILVQAIEDVFPFNGIRWDRRTPTAIAPTTWRPTWIQRPAPTWRIRTAVLCLRHCEIRLQYRVWLHARLWR